MECLFHEKPFAGVNGSGKHVNFSLGNASRATCCCPATPRTRTRSSWCSARPSIRAVHKYGGLLRASVASATNDHRLGANEAPPAIISIFLGDQLADVFEQIAKGAATSSKGKGTMIIGVDTLPGAADRPRRPQPHQPVRVHRQPVRVPRPGLDADGRRADGHASTRSWPRRSTTSRPSSRRRSAAGTDFDTAVQNLLTDDHHRPRRGGVQRRRLLRRSGRSRPRERGPAEPAHHARRAARADHRTRPSSCSRSTRSSTTREMHSRYEIGLEQYALTDRRRGQADARDRHAR